MNEQDPYNDPDMTVIGELPDRLPPYNLQAEEAVLGSIIIDDEQHQQFLNAATQWVQGEMAKHDEVQP